MAPYRLPDRFLQDAKSCRFKRIFWRKGERLAVTAYGVSYMPLYEILGEKYVPCTDISLPSWYVLCPAN